MSQLPPPYPSGPYSPQFNYYQPVPDLLAPARRAGVLMIVVAVLMLLSGICCAGLGAMLPQITQQRPDIFANANLPAEITPKMIQYFFVIAGVGGFFIAIVMIVLGLFVRRGGLGAIITAIVLTSLILLGLLFNVISGLTNVGSMPPADMAIGMCMFIVPLALFALLLAWLIQAARAAPRISAMQHQMQAQMWQYQQHYAAQGGYGAQSQPQAPPPLPQQPPPDPNDPPPQ